MRPTRALACALVCGLSIGSASAVVDAQTPVPLPPSTGRVKVTPELARSAFADPVARTILQRARAARLTQDSALHAYDAKSLLRVSLGMGLGKHGPDKLLLRTEQAARVRWAGGTGVSIEPTGRRSGFPMGAADLDLTNATPIPYFPGRESLWIPSSRMGVVAAEVDEREFIHPLAAGAEAYYRYTSGDSLTIRLPDGRAILIRELRITARRPGWRTFVGSFWFDAASGSLVRAAYRTSAKFDLWQEASDEQRRKIAEVEARAVADTGAAARRARRTADSLRGGWLARLGFKIAQGTFTPARANLSAVTVEYGLFEGRFWLPTRNEADGEIEAGVMRLPVRWQERFEYDNVNDGGVHVPSPEEAGLQPGDSVWFGLGNGSIVIGGDARGDEPASPASQAGTPAARAARLALEDSLVRQYASRADSLRARAAIARAAGDTARALALSTSAERFAARARQVTRRREGCATDSAYYAGGDTRYGGAVRAIIRVPCDVSTLLHSPDLPGSIYDDNPAVFDAADRDALLASLDYSLQPGWAPRLPDLGTGLAFLRYNRIEALSIGASATSALGRGYTAQATARIGIGDHVPNAELSLARSNGRDAVRAALFQRLSVANDDWGAPLSLGASLANLLYAHDDGFYYRTLGAEVAGTRDAPGSLSGTMLSWRAFVERQRSAGAEPNTHVSLKNLFGDAAFEQNIDAVSLTALGAGVELSRTLGADPAKLKAYGRIRLEGAFTNRSVGAAGYGRAMFDATMSRGYGPLALAITGAAGTSAGTLPVQRAFYLGGLQTVRGQTARPVGDGRVGTSFWLGRVEIGPRWLAARPTVFYDAGWAGDRTHFARGRPLSGAGVGWSLLDGMVRFDAARGIWPDRQWRFDLSLGARF